MMATYLYKCPKCEHTKEHSHGMNASPYIGCGVCFTRMQKVINAEYSGMTRKTTDGSLSPWEDTKFR